MNTAEKFAAFHKQNPRVYFLLVKYARDGKKRGIQRMGIGQLYEVVRWFSHAGGSDDFKLPNEYRAYYARLIMAENLDLAGVFELRASQADDDLETLF